MADNHVKKTITNLPTNTGKVTIVLINAVLENVHTQNGPYLLESNAHHKHIRKLKSDPSLFRPDILHHCLLTLIDSPLNKAGKLSLFISTHKNVLIAINPKTRIPRTYIRFCSLMSQLLEKRVIKSEGNSSARKWLLKVVKSPVTRHLEPGCLKIGTSVTGKLVRLTEFVDSLPEGPVLYTVGAQAHGVAKADYEERCISVSKLPLSAAAVLARVCFAYEMRYGIM